MICELRRGSRFKVALGLLLSVSPIFSCFYASYWPGSSISLALNHLTTDQMAFQPCLCVIENIFIHSRKDHKRVCLSRSATAPSLLWFVLSPGAFRLPFRPQRSVACWSGCRNFSFTPLTGWCRCSVCTVLAVLSFCKEQEVHRVKSPVWGLPSPGSLPDSHHFLKEG